FLSMRLTPSSPSRTTIFNAACCAVTSGIVRPRVSQPASTRIATLRIFMDESSHTFAVDEFHRVDGRAMSFSRGRLARPTRTPVTAAVEAAGINRQPSDRPDVRMYLNDGRERNEQDVTDADFI